MPTPRFVREPLVHFVVLGAILFAAHHLLLGTGPRGALVVDDAWARARAGELARSLGRPATADELAAGLEDAIAEELLYREGLRLGLDQGDPIVRRRVVQKMRFVHEERATIAAVDDAAIADELAAAPERYALPERRSLTHVFFAGGGAAAAEEAAERARAALTAGADPAGVGDPWPHGQVIARRSPAALRGIFGDAVADAIAAAPVGEWQAVASPLGWHVFRVDRREPASAPELAAVRERAAAAIREARRREAAAAGVAALRRATPLRVEVSDAGLRSALEGR